MIASSPQLIHLNILPFNNIAFILSAIYGFNDEKDRCICGERYVPSLSRSLACGFSREILMQLGSALKGLANNANQNQAWRISILLYKMLIF